MLTSLATWWFELLVLVLLAIGVKYLQLIADSVARLNRIEVAIDRMPPDLSRLVEIGHWIVKTMDYEVPIQRPLSNLSISTSLINHNIEQINTNPHIE
jgi:hypothetical protein